MTVAAHRTGAGEGEGEALAVLARIGTRVRQARAERGMSRRELSEASGVSPRYLAQLEAGEGNVSVGLLYRIARALDRSLTDFVGSGDAAGSPWDVAAHFSAADAQTQAAVLRLLGKGRTDTLRARRICLIGLRGAGKSTLGRLAGAVLGTPFVELNREIEAHDGMPIAEIMDLYGAEGLRAQEAQALERVIAGHDRLILAAGGGIVSDATTYGVLLARFHTIWVTASPEEHMNRVRAQGDERPMAGNPAAMTQLRRILASREPLYRQALARLDTSGRARDVSVRDLVTLIRDRRFLEAEA